jgi:hypothetical protein
MGFKNAAGADGNENPDSIRVSSFFDVFFEVDPR